MKKITLFTICFMALVNTANACGGAKQPDGSWHIKYNFTRNIDGKTYLCCVHTTQYSKNENCKTKEDWIAYFEKRSKLGDINYMSDLADVEINRNTMSDEKVNFDKEENDNTPALGKVQNKLNNLGSSIFDIIGL